MTAPDISVGISTLPSLAGMQISGRFLLPLRACLPGISAAEALQQHFLLLLLLLLMGCGPQGLVVLYQSHAPHLSAIIPQSAKPVTAGVVADCRHVQVCSKLLLAAAEEDVSGSEGKSQRDYLPAHIQKYNISAIFIAKCAPSSSEALSLGSLLAFTLSELEYACHPNHQARHLQGMQAHHEYESDLDDSGGLMVPFNCSNATINTDIA